MIVILTNGTRIKIPKETAQAIMQALLKTPRASHDWQCILDTEKNETSGFNLMYVAAICSEEDILTEQPPL